MQAEKSAFFICQTSVMPLLGGKRYRITPYSCQGSPAGRSAERKSSSLRSGIFFRQALTQKGNPGEGGL